MKKNKGFTMMELLIVVAVIAVMIAIALPTFRNAQIKSNQEADIQAVSALYTDVQAEYEIHGKPVTKTLTDYVLKEDFNGDRSQFGGLPDNFTWAKGGTVTISVDKDGNYSIK